MAENYEIRLGIDLDTSDLQTKINDAGSKAKPIPIKVEIENLTEIKKQIRNLGGTKSKAKVAIPIDTTSLESSLKDVSTAIKDIRSSIGTIDNKSGMKSLLSSINQISSALEKASNQFESLNANLNALSGKDLNLNLGISLGGSNPIGRNAAYGSKVRNDTLPQLKEQMNALVKYYNDTYKTAFSEFEVLQKMVSGTKLGTGDFFETFLFGKDSVATRMNSGSLASQMQAYKQYIDMFKQAASLRGLDIGNVTSGFSKSADQLIQDAQDVQTGAKEMEDSFEKLKQVFGGGNSLNVDGISAQLDSIVVDLGEIKTALQGLSSGASLEGLTASFDKLSNSIELLVKNCANIKTVINDGVGGLDSSVDQVGNSVGNVGSSFSSNMRDVTITAKNTTEAIQNMREKLSSMRFDDSSVDAVAKDLEEIGISIKEATVAAKGNHIDISVKGIDSAGEAVTVIRRLNTETGGIETVGTRIKQSFSTSDDVIREVNKEINTFVKLQSQIGKIKVKIGTLEAAGGSANQIAELNSQLEVLENTYDRLMHTFMKTASANADIITMDDVARLDAATDAVERDLRELDAKVADVKAKLAQDIKGSFGKYDLDVVKIESSFSRLSKQPDEIRLGIDRVKEALKAMKEASTVDELIASNELYKNSLKEVEEQLKKNRIAEQDKNSSQKLEQDKKKFSSQIGNWLKDNSAAVDQFGDRIRELQRQIESCDRTQLDGLKREFETVKQEAKLAGKTGKTFGDGLKEQFSKYSQYFSVASLFMYAEQGLRSMFEQVKLIDSAMTELKKVTDETNSTYNEFLTNAATNAKKIGTTIDGLVSSTADFARLGYGFEDAQGLAKVANIYAVVGDEINGVEGATESLISTMAAFKDEMNGMSDTDFAMSIIDVFNELGNNFAISSGGLGEALERSASSLAAANNSLHESAAMITAANEVTQNPEKVGNAMKTISMRIRGAKTEMEELGEDTSGMVESTAKLRQEIMALSGVDIMLND